MPAPAEPLPLVLWILLGVQTALLLLLWLGQLIQGARLRRIERRLAEPPSSTEPELQRVKSSGGEGGRHFEQWLDQDPARRDLPKKEQFAGFRKWRAEQGMNWSPGDPGA